MCGYRTYTAITLGGLLAGLVLCFSPMATRADVLERIFIMPGPVIKAHAEFEDECKNCHAPLADTAQRELCVACHKDVGADIREKLGLHGRDSRARDSECVVCHTDHEGRNKNIVILKKKKFDHGFTDFPLLGQHAEASCSACHSEDELYRESPSECVACHREDDRHEGSLGDACGDCHNAADWRFVRFDHSTTKFPLTGGHKNTTCEACHRTQDYAATPSECVDCHKREDVHKGRNGPECGDCHVSETWSRVTFNHARLTGFALTAGHDNLACQDCHRDDDYTGLNGDDCNACHVDDDVHNGRNGTDCRACHAVSDWAKFSFDHLEVSDFALLGTHASLQCVTCHETNLQEALPRDCGGCHVDDDPHNGQLGLLCADCHGNDSWIASIRFDHDLTRFPLVGLHADVACEQCHASSAFHDAPENCSDCHRDVDPHQETFGLQCENCHNSRDWQAWNFDHDTQTDFVLTGSHIDAACDACHAVPVNGDEKVPVGRNCVSCHRRDEPHLGRFGTECGSCHTTVSFREIEGL